MCHRAGGNSIALESLPVQLESLEICPYDVDALIISREDHNYRCIYARLGCTRNSMRQMGLDRMPLSCYERLSGLAVSDAAAANDTVSQSPADCGSISKT